MKNSVKKYFKAIFVSSILVTSQVYATGERDPLLTYLLMDQMEISNQSNNPVSWDAIAWVGKDWHKFYLKTEGEIVHGQTETENQLLYSRPIEKFWDIQMGLGYDTTPEESKTWGVIGLQGLAPYFFETNAVILANDKNMGFRLDTEYEALFTQKLILTPSLKLSAYASDDESMAIGSGVSSTELGLRLRYEFSRKFAPYIGLKFNQSYGKTADYTKSEGGSSSEASLVAGLRFWF
ncbi:copper resistance protein CopB [Hydrogenovibrio sp. SC-1]|uniref:copper resistance protein B n=1 Tax=Hydrogenovibrio sp. SC-1 TaxID=2065820 RepID=UPI000C7D9E1E|nr:copper resistance protein B [Hydrogenovibrio sp. SC-1]PLA74944.1 copper resistance protein CopB [Hydrogenovibrio sp. SC-1]